MSEEEEVIRVKTKGEYSLECRFYENKYPDTDEVIMVNVADIGEMGAYVTLLEYNNKEGMILLSELTRKRIRSVHKLIRVRRNEVVMVLRVDKEKGYIDLSKRRVSAEDIAKCEDRYNKAKAVHSLLRHVADLQKIDLEDLYIRVGWPLYKKYGHAYNAFKLALTDSEEDIFEGLEVDDITKEQIVSYVKRRLAPQPIKIRADIEVKCFAYEGIDAIKEALLLGGSVGAAESPINIKLIAPPMYVMTCMTLDKDIGIESLNSSIEKISELITEKGGSLDVKMAPKAVSDHEETELQQMLDRLALENEEVDGDDDEA